MKWMFTTIIGIFVTDEKYNSLDYVPFNNLNDYLQKVGYEQSALKKHKDAKKAQNEQFQHFLSQLHDQKHFPLFHAQNTALTVKSIREAVNDDLLIIHAISNSDELDKTTNMLVKRLREWYELTLPEFSRSVYDHALFVRSILEKSKKQLLSEMGLDEGESMGTDLKKEDLDEVLLLAEHIQSAYKLRERHIAYLESVLKKATPNLLELCGATIAAKLIASAGSLKRLALLPSSTVQLLGAEKALFRHLTKKTRPPKHGLIHEHPLIQKAARQDRGKVARALADKISMCARLDYFKGEFKAPEYRKELEERFG